MGFAIALLRTLHNIAVTTTMTNPPFQKSFCLLALVLPLAGCGKKVATEDSAKPPAPPPVVKSDADWPMFRGDSALTGIAHGELATPLKLLWSFKTGGPVNSSAVVAEGKVFVGSGDNQVYALDLKSGAQIWAFKTGGPVEAPPLALNGRIVVGSDDGNLYALDAKTGTQIWKYATGDKIIGSANWFTPQPGKTNLLVGSYDFSLYCLDEATGQSNWVYETGNYINGTPAIAEGHTVFGGCDAVLHIVSVTNGTKVGEVPAGAYVAASVALSGGSAFYGHYENEFQCVNLNIGAKTWTFHDRNFPYFSSPAITTNRVVFGGRDKLLHCVNRSDGKAVWQFATRGKVDSSPVVVGDKVVVGSDDGRIYIVSLKDGNELWSYEVGQPVGSSPAIADGRIIIGSDDGSVYCFGEK